MLYFISKDDPKYPEYEEYGYDITLLLEQKFTPGRILAMQVEIKNELEKDDRVSQAIVTVDGSKLLRQSILTITINIIPNSQLGTFTMILEVADAAIQLFEVS